MIVACHHHYVPKEVVFGTASEVRELYWQGVPDVTIRTLKHPSLYQIDAQLRDMDAAGIDSVVLSCVAGLHATMEGCRFINDRTAQIGTSLSDIQDWFLSRGAVSQKVDLNKFIDDSFAKYATGVLGPYK